MIPRASWARSLDGIAAFRIALQVEFLGETNVNVFRTPRRSSDIASVGDGYRPIEVSIVRRAAELDASLWRPKNRRIVCGTQSARYIPFAVNVKRREIDTLCLCKGQIQFKLTEPDVQRVLRQPDAVAQIAIFEPAVSHAAIGIGRSD